MNHSNSQHTDVLLKRQIGVVQATFLGLGSILGTGVFVSLGIAAGVSGSTLLLAIPLAAFVALCNALSSAQLAAVHPVSGGTYEYAYQRLSPKAGQLAGWMFLCAKSASAATAGLGFAGYLKSIMDSRDSSANAIAVVAVLLVGLLVISGLRRSAFVNSVIVILTVLSLLGFCFSLSGDVQVKQLSESFDSSKLLSARFLESVALIFVAYTGYGRIATLGEEIRDPAKNIPLAILSTLVISAALYLIVGLFAVGSVGAAQYAQLTLETGAPLQQIAHRFGHATAEGGVRIGAVIAMLGVLLNLILGLSRVVLAMGRRGDLPKVVTRIDSRGETPFVAVIMVTIVIAMIAAVGSIRLAWSFSALTVLIYYGMTNLCALRLSPSERLYPRVFAVLGFVACLTLAFWVGPAVWLFASS